MLSFNDIKHLDINSINRRLHNAHIVVEGAVGKFNNVSKDNEVFYLPVPNPNANIGNYEAKICASKSNFLIYPTKLGWWFRLDGSPFTVEPRQDKTYWWGLNNSTHRSAVINNGLLVRSRFIDILGIELLAMFNIKPAASVVVGDRQYTGCSLVYHNVRDDWKRVKEQCREFYGGWLNTDPVGPEAPDLIRDAGAEWMAQVDWNNLRDRFIVPD